MSIQKNKTHSGIGSLHATQVGQGFLESSSIAKGKIVDIPHSYYYLFEDDDYATLGRNLSEYIVPKTANTSIPSKGKKS